MRWTAGLFGMAMMACVARTSAAEMKEPHPSSNARFSVRSIKDVAYYDGKDADPLKHTLDLYLPRNQKDFPLVLFVHGGAWQRGDKNAHLGVYAGLGSFLAKHGVGVAVANYRLSPSVKHPEHAKDVARAFAWLQQNIVKYGGDPNTMFLCGHSAGGHLVSLLATDDSYLKAVGLSPRQIRGVVTVSGVYYLEADQFPRVFGTDPAEHHKAWPLKHVKPGLPPFLVLYADKDLPGCDKEAAEKFCRALRDKGNEVHSFEAHASNHYQILFSMALAEDPVADKVLTFIQAHSKIREALDLPYGDGKDRHFLDVFSPQGAAASPVVLFIHGGAWMFGDKDLFGLYRGVGQFLAQHGFVAVLVNYRLSPAVQHPEHVKDIARAYAWTRQTIRKYGGDPDRIFLAGHSAGGHLAALLATDLEYWQDPTLGLKSSDRASLRGVIGVSGVYRIPHSNEATEMIAEMLYGVRSGGAVRPETGTKPKPKRDFRLFQMVFGDDAKVRDQASPVNHVRKGLPPFLLLVAERELPLLPEMADDFASKLKAAGNMVEQKRIPGCHHNTILFNLTTTDDPTAKALLEFLNRYAFGRGTRPGN